MVRVETGRGISDGGEGRSLTVTAAAVRARRAQGIGILAFYG